jgi:hypothetical protein
MKLGAYSDPFGDLGADMIRFPSLQEEPEAWLTTTRFRDRHLQAIHFSTTGLLVGIYSNLQNSASVLFSVFTLSIVRSGEGKDLYDGSPMIHWHYGLGIRHSNGSFAGFSLRPESNSYLYWAESEKEEIFDMVIQDED